MYKKTEVARRIIGRAEKELPCEPVEAGVLKAGEPDGRVSRPSLARLGAEDDGRVLGEGRFRNNRRRAGLLGRRSKTLGGVR